jgi:glycolate oxidase FAD binding subunit
VAEIWNALKELERLGVVVDRVEKPADEMQLQDILKEAASRGHKVLPVGGGTSLGVARLPEKIDVVLNMTGMSEVTIFDGRNLNMTVQAGITIDSVNDYLAKQGKGFLLPLDPPLSNRATIGGAYASNLNGPLRLGYGTFRDLALGASAVDAKGRAVQIGGVTVKNVSGYDLTKFFIGSAGSLCIMTKISFRIYPLPEAACVCETVLDGVQAVQRFLDDLRSSVLVPSGVLATDEKGGYRVIAAFEGHPKAVKRQEADFAQMGEKYGGTGKSRQSRKAMSKRLREAIDPEGVHTLSFKVSVPPVQGPAMLDAVCRAADRSGLQAKAALLAHNGILYIHAAEPDPATCRQVIEEIRETAGRHGGHAVLLRASRGVLEGWGPTIAPVLLRSVLSPIKDKLDPGGLLPPLA